MTKRLGSMNNLAMLAALTALAAFTGGCGKLASVDDAETPTVGADEPGDAPPSDDTSPPTLPDPPTPRPATDGPVARVGKQSTALALDDDSVYFVTSSDDGARDRIGRVPKAGGPVVELGTRPAPWGLARSIVRVGSYLVVTSGHALYTMPTAGGTQREVAPPATMSVQSSGHLLASNGSLAVWLGTDGNLYRVEPITGSASPFATPPSSIPRSRLSAAALAISDDAVFVVATVARETDGVWEAHVFRYATTGQLEREVTIEGRASIPIVTATRDRLLLVFGGSSGTVDDLDPSSLVRRPSVPFGATAEIQNAVAYGQTGLAALVRTPDTFGGKLDALQLVALTSRNTNVPILGDSGAVRLGSALVLDRDAAYWVGRSGPSDGAPGVIERRSLPAR